MPPDTSTSLPSNGEEGDLAKAFQELAKGERTAAALESQLSAMEEKIEALLAQAEREQQDVQRLRSGQAEVEKSGQQKSEGQ